MIAVLSFGLLGEVQASLTIARDKLCQEVLMLAKEGEPGGAPSVKNKLGHI